MQILELRLQPQRKMQPFGMREGGTKCFLPTLRPEKKPTVLPE